MVIGEVMEDLGINESGYIRIAGVTVKLCKVFPDGCVIVMLHCSVFDSANKFDFGCLKSKRYTLVEQTTRVICCNRWWQ